MVHVVDTREGYGLMGREGVRAYWASEAVRKLYFEPKRVSVSQMDAFIEGDGFSGRMEALDRLERACPIASRCERLFERFSKDVGLDPQDQVLYLIVGCGTTTIYTVQLDGVDVSVLCVESLGGNEQVLAAYLAHEYTHLVRKSLLGTDIFESCVGERLVTEGIAESYSKDVVPALSDAACCIVEEATVRWVDDHLHELEALVADSLEMPELMKQLFYMFAQIDYPVRCGYVLGYRLVRRYLTQRGLRTRAIMGIDWHRVFDVED